MPDTPAKPKRLLILGASGKVGTVLGRYLEHLKEYEIETPDHEVCPLPDAVDRIPRHQFDVIVCLAAIAKPAAANKDPRTALEVNVATVDRLIHHFGVTPARLVFASTVKTGAIDSMYAWSKIAAEVLVASTASQGHPHVTMMRLGNVLDSADVLKAFVSSVTGGTPGFVEDTTEYFQSQLCVKAELTLALSTELSSGSILTPLLPVVPIPFLAGVLAGYSASLGTFPGRAWQPEYRPRPDAPPLIPPWWLEYTRIQEISVRDANGDVQSFSFLVTDFTRKEVDNAEGVKKLQEDIDRLTTPHFGEFVESLQMDTRIHQRRESR